ncbi:MAG: polysaccharide biosynthesis C-terminal domain-containing protein, partial [Clostridia bacterium]|nr:polysaccharide biosynthesis C-terminal domain-containing protein [Clostridia bacterium]
VLTMLRQAILPVALTTITLPLVKAVDSFTAIRLIGGGVNEATAKFGLYGGVAEPIVALPVSVCFAIAVSGLPFIAKGSARSEKKVVVYTLILSVFGAAAVFIFAPVAIKLLYPRLTGEDASAAVRLIRILTPSVVGLSVVQTLSTVFIAKNRSFVAPLALIAGAAVKVAVTFAVVPVPEIGVYGYAISDIFCYFVALIVFLLYSIKEKNLRSDKENATVRRWTWGKKRRSFGKRV